MLRFELDDICGEGKFLAKVALNSPEVEQHTIDYRREQPTNDSDRAHHTELIKAQALIKYDQPSLPHHQLDVIKSLEEEEEEDHPNLRTHEDTPWMKYLVVAGFGAFMIAMIVFGYCCVNGKCCFREGRFLDCLSPKNWNKEESSELSYRWKENSDFTRGGSSDYLAQEFLGGNLPSPGHQGGNFPSPGHQGFASPGHQGGNFPSPGHQGFASPGHQGGNFQSPGHQVPGFPSPGYQGFASPSPGPQVEYSNLPGYSNLNRYQTVQNSYHNPSRDNENQRAWIETTTDLEVVKKIMDYETVDWVDITTSAAKDHFWRALLVGNEFVDGVQTIKFDCWQNPKLRKQLFGDVPNVNEVLKDASIAFTKFCDLVIQVRKFLKGEIGKPVAMFHLHTMALEIESFHNYEIKNGQLVRGSREFGKLMNAFYEEIETNPNYESSWIDNLPSNNGGSNNFFWYSGGDEINITNNNYGSNEDDYQPLVGSEDPYQNLVSEGGSSFVDLVGDIPSSADIVTSEIGGNLFNSLFSGGGNAGDGEGLSSMISGIGGMFSSLGDD